jgi:prephenate dehydratase
VLAALVNHSINYGTFAWESSRVGLVAETQEAIKDFNFKKLDELDIPTEHVLLKPIGSAFDAQAQIRVYSHPQALKEHCDFLKSYLPNATLVPEVDTA